MDHIAHYGVMGMKWGVRKDGMPQGFQYGDARPSKSNAAKTHCYHLKNKKPREYTQPNYTSIKKAIGIINRVPENFIDMDAHMPAGRGNNCVNCSIAYELTRRGYPCEARPSFGPMPLELVMNNTFRYYSSGSQAVYRNHNCEITADIAIDGSQAQCAIKHSDGVTNSSNSRDVLEALDSYLSSEPPSSRGIIVMNAKDTGHLISYEKLPDGQTLYIDPSLNFIYGHDGMPDLYDIYSGYIYGDTPINVCRLDNVELVKGR